MSSPDLTVVRRLFAAGVDAVVDTTESFTADDWPRRACGEWSGEQTARHLAAVAGWYHEWLDRALAGETSAPFTAEELPDRNEAAIEALGDLDGAEAVALFVERATSYLLRVAEHWDVPYAYPFGLVTAGLHCGVAAAEWHIHAWDLSTVRGSFHAPADPAALFMAAGTCVARAQGGIRGAVLERLVPLGARRSPWRAVLARSGRRHRR